MSVSKRQRKIYTVLIVVSSLALILGTVLPYLAYMLH
jgi:hypothetical protein